VRRSQDQDSLADQDASRTTAFFIGGYLFNDWRTENGRTQVGAKFRTRLEEFLSRGGRAVLVEQSSALKSETQGWEVENEWNQTPRESSPTWLSPDLHAMPAGSEMMYLGGNAPWLKTGAQWTALYAAPADADSNAGTAVRVHMATRRVGKGELVAASQESFLLNEAIRIRPNPVILDFLAGGRPVIWVDETLHGLRQDEGVLWLVQRYRLYAALMLFWATLLALLWSMSGELVRLPRRDASAPITRHGEGAGVAARRLLRRSVAPEQVAAECWEHFRRRSPQDGQAISADPRWGPRLRAALARSPLRGYNELTQLIAERRASAKGLTLGGSAARNSRDVSPKAISEEAPLA
jgi:hypothetical protein